MSFGNYETIRRRVSRLRPEDAHGFMGLTNMKETRIIERKGLVIIINDEAHYDCHHDPVTGDWQVTSSEGTTIQGKWLLSKDDAIQYVLEQIGIVGDTNYERAPDRTSA